MHLIIDGYNLLHVRRSLTQLSSVELQWERDELIHRLSAYQQLRPCEITIVFDGWQGGQVTEKREWKRRIELIFSRLGEKADEVIKRLVKEKGSGAIVITSDREVARYAEKMAATVIPSDQFREKIDRSVLKVAEGFEEEGRERRVKGKGPSKRLSKKEKRKISVLKKL